MAALEEPRSTDHFLGLRGEPCLQLDPALQEGDAGEVEKVESNEVRLSNPTSNDDKSYNMLRWVYQDSGGGVNEDVNAIDEHMLEAMVRTFAQQSRNVSLVLFGASSTRKREFAKELSVKILERMVEMIDKHDGTSLCWLSRFEELYSQKREAKLSRAGQITFLSSLPPLND